MHVAMDDQKTWVLCTGSAFYTKTPETKSPYDAIHRILRALVEFLVNFGYSGKGAPHKRFPAKTADEPIPATQESILFSGQGHRLHGRRL